MDPLYGQRSTYSKQGKDKWVLIDANEKILGRLASRVAKILLGKETPEYQPGSYTGDRVIIINASGIKVSGKKMQNKQYRRHTGYMGGLVTTTMEQEKAKSPEKVLMMAIRGMLPKNSYGRELLRRTRIFADAQHGMEAQKPEVTNV